MSCSGGSWPAGCDEELPKHVVYPGCLAFYRTLISYKTGKEEERDNFWAGKHKMGDLVFLSARPHAYKDAAETKSYDKFKKLVDEGKLDFNPIMLPGALPASLRSSVGALFWSKIRGKGDSRAKRGKLPDLSKGTCSTSMRLYTQKSAWCLSATTAKLICTWASSLKWKLRSSTKSKISSTPCRTSRTTHGGKTS